MKKLLSLIPKDWGKYLNEFKKYPPTPMNSIYTVPDGEKEVASDRESNQEKTTRDEITQDETTQDETTQDETTQDETTQQETTQQETTQQETTQQKTTQQACVMLSAPAPKIPKLMCNICEKSFKDSWLLKRHNHRMHN